MKPIKAAEGRLPGMLMHPGFKYVPADKTDIRKTFARVLREQRELADKQRELAAQQRGQSARAARGP